MPGQIYPAWVDLLLAEDAANAQKPSACPPAEKAVQVSQGSSVTGCPLSAVVENETTQTLADGTHIQNTVKVLVYRDSLGRIRYESYAPTPAGKDAPESPNFIQILDPVAGLGTFFRRKMGLPRVPA